MPLFTWYKKYSVNNEELDGHHRKLFDIFNKMYDKCLHAESAECKCEIIDELIAYADYHFKTEEQYMADIGYRDIDRHILLHRDYLQKVMQMQQAKDKSDYDLTKQLIEFLYKTLLSHVLEEDMKYKR